MPSSLLWLSDLVCLQCVLPLEFANRAIVMPIPPPEDSESSSIEYIGVLPQTAFIIVVVVIVGAVLLLIVGFSLLWWWWHKKKSDNLLSQLVRSDQLEIITKPVVSE